MRLITLKQRKELSNEDIANIVITAFEGGSNYWMEGASSAMLTASGWHTMSNDQHVLWRTEDGFGPYANPTFWENDARGYVVRIEDNESATYVLTARRISDALQYMANDENLRVNDVAARLLNEDYDADDADYLIQMSVFDEVVYG